MLKPTLVAAALTLLVSPLIAQPGKPATPPGEDWVALFNGKDLTGWTEVGKEKWTVEGGIIQGQAITQEYGYLKTNKLYRDFHLGVKFLCEGDGNSGVFFHTDFKPGTADVSQGLQFEVDCSINKHTGGIYGDGRQWIVWPSPELETVIRPTDWNEMRMTVVGRRYVCYLNGTLMVDFTDPTPKSFDGYISLQLHSGGLGRMRFKDIYIRDLTKR